MNNDTRYMKAALMLAHKAEEINEIPVGAVIVKDGSIIGCGYNKREKNHSPIAHAEIEAITEAAKKLGGWHLENCELYVTLEPCPMCAGAIINSRIKRVIYATKDNKSGAFGSVLNMNSYPLNHKCTLTVGVCKDECSKLLTDFFKKLRSYDCTKKRGK